MYTLRHYQQEAVDHAVEFFNSKNKKRPILDLPTGSGKSIIIAYIVKALEGNVLILQPSKELLQQNYRKYSEVIQDHDDLWPASVYSASVGLKERGRVTFATIGSIHKKPELFADVEHVIIDECHYVPPSPDSMYVSFLKAINVQVLGLTATPYRLKTYNDPEHGKISKINLLPRERPKFFNTFLYTVSVKQMYDEGFLCPLNYIPMRWDSTDLKANSTGAEFTDESVKKALDRNEIIKKIPNILDQAFKKKQKSCLVFVKTVDEARQLAAATPFAEYIEANTKPKERERIVKSFKAGNIKTVFNVGILTTGFDYPGLDTIILARPTMSLTLYVQMVGRGMRTNPGKEKCAIVDMCGNIKRFGKVEELRLVDDYHAGWVLRNDNRIISGRPLIELV